MKRVLKAKRDQESSASPLFQRLERGIAFTLAVALTSLYVLGERGTAHAALAQSDGLRQPLGSGGVVMLAILAIIVLNAMFVAAETAVELLKAHHIKHVREGNSVQSGRLQALVDGKQRYVAACTLGSQTARLALVFVGFLLAQGLALFLHERAGWNFDYGTILLSALIIAVPVVLVNIIVGELVPKSYASLHPHRVALGLYRFIKASAFVFSLPAGLIVWIANLLTALFGGRASFTANQAEEEIKNLVESAQETGEIEVDEKELLHSVFEFTDTVAREVMTPRVDMDAMPMRSDPAEVVRVIQETGHSRIPLYEETDDQIVGIIHAKDLLMAMVNSDGPVNLRPLMRPALFVPENKNLHELLTEMRAGRSQLAVVQDDFGGTAGIVTIEDIVEELVGDIVDEYDVEEPEVVVAEDGWLVDGKTHVDDVNDEIGSDFESEEFETIGGFVFGQFGRQPKQGEEIQVDGYRFHIVETDGRRVGRLRIKKLSDAEAAAH